ncbi:hypothetical protein G7046_g814 [Stylonectria norvegica]|nr:hypothetical protein G7046_g814 [Stylonectria norvegica]
MQFSNIVRGYFLARLVSALPSGHDQSQWPLLRTEAQKEEEFDLEPSAHYAFAGITTFSQLPAVQCLTEEGPVDDILVMGFPFDTATSYRTGTRFGPNAVRQGSRAASLAGHYNYRQAINPFEQNISIVDCGDFPISPFDNALAFAQMEEWYTRLLNRDVKNPDLGATSKKVIFTPQNISYPSSKLRCKLALKFWEDTRIAFVFK